MSLSPDLAKEEPVPGAAPSRFDRYKLIRDEIAHEDNLMGARLSWFMASQAFLLTALAIVQGPQHGLPNLRSNYLFPLVPIIAILSNMLIFFGVLAGLEALRRWRRMFNENAEDFADLPRIRKDEGIIRLGWAAPLGLPLVFLAAWIYLLAAGLSVTPAS